MENQPELVVAMAITAWGSGAFFGAWLSEWIRRRKEEKQLPPRQVEQGAPGAAADAGDVGAIRLSDGDTVTQSLEQLDRKFRMLSGRLNRLDPPRKGTGAVDGEETTHQDAPGSTIPNPLGSSVMATRSQVLAAWRRRRG